MEFQLVRKYLEKTPTAHEPTKIESLPEQFFDPLIMQGVRPVLIEPGRVVCSFRVPPRLLNTANTLHGAAIASLLALVGSSAIFTAGAPVTGASVEFSVSYLDGVGVDEEIEIEARNLRVEKAVAVVSVEMRKKDTGKLIAQGRHTKYLAVTSKL
ncbi:Acyl-coenzyme A thioesterase 13-like protein [Drosera capensis]